VYEAEITPEGLRHLRRLSEKVRVAALETILSPIAENPGRSGKPLVGELAGLFSACRGDYRIIYEVPDADRVVLIHRIQHRGEVYRRR
jgi:mRNA interferase RelE/StbE